MVLASVMNGKRRLDALIEYRDRSGLTRVALGDRLGVSRVCITRWENGDRQIPADRLDAVSSATGIAPAELRPDLASVLKRGNCQ